MPEIKLKHVVSCSSEDYTHKADNLLSSDTYRKWKAARPGEKQISVIVQFEKEEQVHSIDLGNEGSAFIEVLVGHSTSVKEQDYEVLLVTSSFMSPSESRAGTNTNRVRIFGHNQLVNATAQQKWDRVKIICTQPYSKTIAYGVAFVKFHSPPDSGDPPASTPPKLTKLGQFRVKEESPSKTPGLQPGSMFFNRESSSKTPTYRPHTLRLSWLPTASGKRKFEFTKERKESPAPPPSKKPSPIASPESSAGTPTPRAKPSTPKASPAQKSSDKRESLSKPSAKPEPKPRPKPKAEPSEPVPFNRILEGVVFVLSGFQNPFRGELRDKALAMGARYRPDWTPDSTHLICAFSNTPKYAQVKSAGGFIVRKEWVLDCVQDWVSYLALFPLVTDDGSGMDTEDELERVQAESRRKRGENVKKARPGEKVEDPYGGSTDENTDAEEDVDKPIPDLPDFLTGKRFYLYGKFPQNDRRLLMRYIVAFNGVVEDYMSEKVQFVITSEGWHDSFEDALMENANLSFVKPKWIFAINDRQKMLPHQPYTVVP
uniref:DNA repair protein XRCC1 n=1 Tax=Denticeps clupeoides TaxID=299321 RepID=A0AAY4AC49_9TELE